MGVLANLRQPEFHKIIMDTDLQFMNNKKPNKVVSEVDAHDPEYDANLDFQSKVLACLSDIRMYNSRIMKSSESLEESIKDFRVLIHGEDV